MTLKCYLSASIKELLDDDLDLFEQDWVQRGRHLVSDELLDVLLNLSSELLVRTDEQAQQLTQELGDWTVLDVLAGAVRKNSTIQFGPGK